MVSKLVILPLISKTMFFHFLPYINFYEWQIRFLWLMRLTAWHWILNLKGLFFSWSWEILVAQHDSTAVADDNLDIHQYLTIDTKSFTNHKKEYFNLLAGYSSYQAVINEIRICFPIKSFIGWNVCSNHAHRSAIILGQQMK